MRQVRSDMASVEALEVCVGFLSLDNMVFIVLEGLASYLNVFSELAPLSILLFPFFILYSD